MQKMHAVLDKRTDSVGGCGCFSGVQNINNVALCAETKGEWEAKRKGVGELVVIAVGMSASSLSVVVAPPGEGDRIRTMFATGRRHYKHSTRSTEHNWFAQKATVCQTLSIKCNGNTRFIFVIQFSVFFFLYFCTTPVHLFLAVSVRFVPSYTQYMLTK